MEDFGPQRPQKKDWATLLAEKLPKKGVNVSNLKAQAQETGLTEEDFGGAHEQVLDPSAPSDPLAQQTLALMQQTQAAQPSHFEFVGAAKQLKEALARFNLQSSGNCFGVELGNQFRFVITAEANPAGAFQCHIALLMGFADSKEAVGEVGSVFTAETNIDEIVKFASDLHDVYSEVNGLYQSLGAVQVRI
jgi:hypothetical protein